MRGPRGPLHVMLYDRPDSRRYMQDTADARIMGSISDHRSGETTTHEWAERIAIHGAMRPVDGAFHPCDLMNHGMTGEQADPICAEFRADGRLKLPEGIECHDPGTGIFE